MPEEKAPAPAAAAPAAAEKESEAPPVDPATAFQNGARQPRPPPDAPAAAARGRRPVLRVRADLKAGIAQLERYVSSREVRFVTHALSLLTTLRKKVARRSRRALPRASATRRPLPPIPPQWCR